MATSAVMGRPKIEGLESFNLRILKAQREALECAVAEERETRSQPSLTVTDLIREYIAKGLAARGAKKKAK